MRYLILCVSVLLLSSCASTIASISPTTKTPTMLNSISSGSIGCSADRIQTYNYNAPVVSCGVLAWCTPTATWTAQCNGKVFYCTGDLAPEICASGFVV